jgi:uncharacterized protein (DUF1778 family)
MPRQAKEPTPGQDGKGKRYPLNTRTTAEVRALLMAAAKLSGRSMTQEVEHRLQRSFEDDRIEAMSKQIEDIAAMLRAQPIATQG